MEVQVLPRGLAGHPERRDDLAFLDPVAGFDQQARFQMLVSGLTSLAQVEHDVVAGRFATAAAKVAIACGPRHPVTGSHHNGNRNSEPDAPKTQMRIPSRETRERYDLELTEVPLLFT